MCSHSAELWTTKYYKLQKHVRTVIKLHVLGETSCKCYNLLKRRLRDPHTITWNCLMVHLWMGRCFRHPHSGAPTTATSVARMEGVCVVLEHTRHIWELQQKWKEISAANILNDNWQVMCVLLSTTISNVGRWREIDLFLGGFFWVVKLWMHSFTLELKW
jgi:hypothetical protein